MITCRICGETKDENMFNVVKSNLTGRNKMCKKCEVRRQNIVLKADDIHDKTIVNTFKDIMSRLGYNLSEDINKQFLQRIKDRYGVILD
jgi:hypothetical protein